jgi:endonuclease/exonuclease/phosphatase family metal-dependent hydrolase
MLSVLALAASAAAVDRPIAGRRLCLRASDTRPELRRLRFTGKDAAIAAPFADPTTSASLTVSNSVAAGQCFAEIVLDPGRWSPLRGDGSQHGYAYVAPTGGTQWVRKIRIRPGKITILGDGAGFPCALDATAQQVPMQIQLRIGADRYCASFGASTLARNVPGRFRAELAPAPSGCPDTDVTVANLNILHGMPCPDPDHCRLTDRIALLFQWIAAVGCPDVVTLQEIPDRTYTALPLIDAHRSTTCPFPYGVTYFKTLGFDEEMILSRYPVVSAELQMLHINFRHITYARIDHPIGPLDVFTTHLASSSDLGPSPCSPCPAECVAAGAVTNRDCQAVQMAQFIETRHDVTTPALATGDFNDGPGTFTYQQFVDRGWTDVHLAAGNPECIPATGVGCTGGRADALAELESTVPNVDERIDYIFLIPPAPSAICVASIDSLMDDDGDATATKVFADQPNPFAPTCGPVPDPICWPSDHNGVQLDLNCE